MAEYGNGNGDSDVDRGEIESNGVDTGGVGVVTPITTLLTPSASSSIKSFCDIYPILCKDRLPEKILPLRSASLIDTDTSLKYNLYSGVAMQHAVTKVFDIEFKAKDGYYYLKAPTPNFDSPETSNFVVVNDVEVKDDGGRVVEKVYTINYKVSGEDVFEFDNHEIAFTHETATLPSVINEITEFSVDLTDIPSTGRNLPINITGTPGVYFTLTMIDTNGNSIAPPKSTYVKSIKNAITRSRRVDLYDVENIEVGMRVSGSNVGDGVFVLSVNDVEAPHVTISKPQTLDIATGLNFSKGSLLERAIIPESGKFTRDIVVPQLKKYLKTLKTAASSSTTLLLDDTTNLEVGMRLSGTYVDGSHTTIKSVDSNTQVTVSTAQTIADETTLAFTISHNIYNFFITVHTETGATLNSNIPTTNPTYYVEQYIDPVITFTPTTTLGNTTVTGDISITKPINYKPQTLSTHSLEKNKTRANIRMVATSTSGAISISSQPKSTNFTNVSAFKKFITTCSGTSTPIVILDNTTGLVAGMRVTGEGVVQPLLPVDPLNDEVISPANQDYKPITIKSVDNDKVITLSSAQTLPCDGNYLIFDNGGTSILLTGLKAVLSEYVPTVGSTVADGVCTVTGIANISKFGKESVTCTVNFDNFLSK